MRKIKELLRLKFEADLSIRQISTSLRIGVGSVHEYLARVRVAGLSWPIWPALALVALHLAWQAATVRIDDPADCLAKFRANRWIGWLMLLGIVASRVLA